MSNSSTKTRYPRAAAAASSAALVFWVVFLISTARNAVLAWAFVDPHCARAWAGLVRRQAHPRAANRDPAFGWLCGRYPVSPVRPVASAWGPRPACCSLPATTLAFAALDSARAARPMAVHGISGHAPDRAVGLFPVAAAACGCRAPLPPAVARLGPDPSYLALAPSERFVVHPVVNLRFVLGPQNSHAEHGRLACASFENAAPLVERRKPPSCALTEQASLDQSRFPRRREPRPGATALGACA